MAELERDRARRRPTADARSRSRDAAHRSASRDRRQDRSASRDRRQDRSASRDREKDRSASRDREKERHRDPERRRDRDRERAVSRDRPHRSPSREKPGANGSSSSSNNSSNSSSSSRKRPHVRYAAPIDAPALAASGSRCGFLRKQADNDPGSWNRYFFALKASTLLYYYNSEADEAPRGVIDLEFLADVKRNGDCLQRAVGGGEHCFRLSGKLPPAVRDKMRPLYLDADSAEDARAWTDALRTHRFSADALARAAADEQRLAQTERALAELEARQAREQVAARATSALAERVLGRLRRLALGSPEALAAGSTGAESENEEEEAGDGKIDLLASLQAMESVVGELQLKVASQQQAIDALREQAAEHERKQREKALKFVAAGFKKAAATRQQRSQTTAVAAAAAAAAGTTARPSPAFAPAASPVFQAGKPAAESESEEDDGASASACSSLTSALEEPAGSGARPKSASNALGLFSRARSRARARTKVAGPAALADSSSSGASNAHGSERDSASTDERTSEESAAGKSAKPGDERLPAGWSRHESRSNPGQFFYAHTSGATSWTVPRAEPEPEDAALDADESGASDDEDDAKAAGKPTRASPADAAGGGKKKRKGWAFKLPRKLTIASGSAAPAAPALASASTSPIEHDESHHEF